MGLICKSGITSMDEMLALDGIWDSEMISLMLPVVLDMQADDAAMMYGATSAAVSQIAGGKAAKLFVEGIQKTKEQARKAMRHARGILNEDERPGGAADAMIAIAEKLGIRAGRGPRAKAVSPGRSTGPTKIQGGK